MLNLTSLLPDTGPLRLLCIGAHSDDLEIGCGGTLLAWLAATRPVEITWVVATASGERADEARRSARQLLKRAARLDVVLGNFRDGFLPGQYMEAKAFFESLKGRPDPHVVLTHRLDDRHQDHRLLGELTWNTWRDHLILEYEVVKYEGDLGLPNLFVQLSRSQAQRKASHLVKHFGSQRSKSWFDPETFLALARLRGLECRSPSGYAEAFHARKLVLAPGDKEHRS